MAPASQSFDFDSLATTTLQLVRPRIADNVFLASKVAMWFLANGRVKFESGGTEIQEALEYSKNDTVGSYSGWDKINVHATDEFTMAKYAWRQVAGTVSISGEEMLKNAGPQQQFNLLKNKVVNLERSFKEYLNEQLTMDSSGKSAKDFLGIDNLIEDAVVGSQSTVGGIDRSTYQWWGNNYDTGSIINLTPKMRSFYNDCSKQLTKPDLILCTQALYEAYEDQNQGKHRITDTRLLDVGFENLRFKGATMMWDDQVITGNMYFITSEYMGITLHSARNFVMTPFKEPIDQDGKIAQMLLAGNMWINNGRFQGVVKFS